MDKLPTVAEFWSMSTAERKRLYDEEGISGSFLKQYWSAYGQQQHEVNLAGIQVLRDPHRAAK